MELGLVLRSVVSLLVIVGGLIAVAWYAKRYRSGANNPMHVVARIGIAKGTSLVIVRVGNRHILVGAGEKGVTHLCELDAEDVQGALDPPIAAPPSRRRGASDARLQALISDQKAGPGTGLVERLQQMTLRTAARGPFRAPPP